MDSLFDLLANRNLDEPPESRLIKDYVQKHFKESVGVQLREADVVILVRSAALAGALRSHTTQLQALMPKNNNQQRRIVFRVGSRPANS